MDELIFRKIVAAQQCSGTLAALACTCTLLRRLVAEEWSERGAGACRELQRLLGVEAADAAAAARAAALLGGTFRRCFLADLHACERSGRRFDGRRQTWDLLSLPGKGAWLSGVDLLATDLQYILMYDRHLQPLGALAFVDRPAGLAASGPAQPRMFFAILSTLLVKCPLHHGLVSVEPPLLLGAADWLHHHHLQPAEQEALAAAAACARWRQRLGPDDDAPLLRASLLRLRVLAQVSLLAGGLAGTLDSALVREVAMHSHGALRLRFLDISGNSALSDASAAQLLMLCPSLRVLHAAGCTQLGPALLAVLAGRLQQRQADEEGRAAGRQREGRPQQGSSRTAVPAAARSLEQLCLASASPSGRQAGQASAPAAAVAALEAEAARGSSSGMPPAEPACRLLESLDLSGCSTKGAALRRALRCLPHLRSLRLNGCAGLQGLLDPLLELEEAGVADSGGGGSKAGKAAQVAAVLTSLTRLEALDSDLSGQHASALLRHCSSLRALSLSGQQLAAEAFDRQQHAAWVPPVAGTKQSSSRHGSSSRTRSTGSGEEGGSCSQASGTPCSALGPPLPLPLPLPSLVHLEVGWGTGGTFLAHLAQQHCRNLASLTVHLGGATSDCHLELMGACCPYLGRLCLRAANVSDIGVVAILRSCSQLTSLHLQGCTGPFSDSLATAWTAQGGAPEVGGASLALASRPAMATPSGPLRQPFRLQELQICWGAAQLSDAGLAALLQPEQAALRVLVLKGCSRLTDRAWRVVAQHAPTLECLALDSCGALPTLHKAAGHGAAGAAMTAAAAGEALAGCQRLLALKVRSCVREAGALAAVCTSVQSLDLE